MYKVGKQRRKEKYCSEILPYSPSLSRIVHRLSFAFGASPVWVGPEIRSAVPSTGLYAQKSLDITLAGSLAFGRYT